MQNKALSDMWHFVLIGSVGSVGSGTGFNVTPYNSLAA